MAITEQEFKELNRRQAALKVSRLKDEEYPDIMVKRPLKYRTKPVTTEDGYFHSTSENARWEELKILETSGVLSDLSRQVKIEVVSGVFWEAQGRFLAPVFWIADFLYFHQGWCVEDWKSKVTQQLPDYKMKRQLFLLRYPNFRYIETTKGSK